MKDPDEESFVSVVRAAPKAGVLTRGRMIKRGSVRPFQDLAVVVIDLKSDLRIDRLQ